MINDGALDLAGDFSSVDLFSSARAEAGGTATGAAISFTVDGGAVNVPSFSIESNGSGDFGGLLSYGEGGDITVALRNGASITASSNFSLYSSGTGGNGDAAGDGTGGAVLLSIANGSLTSPFVRLSSVGFAGNQFSGLPARRYLLGSVSASGTVRVGQGDSAPIRFTGTGTIFGSSVAITSRNTLTYPRAN